MLGTSKVPAQFCRGPGKQNWDAGRIFSSVCVSAQCSITPGTLQHFYGKFPPVFFIARDCSNFAEVEMYEYAEVANPLAGRMSSSKFFSPEFQCSFSRAAIAFIAASATLVPS